MMVVVVVFAQVEATMRPPRHLYGTPTDKFSEGRGALGDGIMRRSVPPNERKYNKNYMWTSCCPENSDPIFKFWKIGCSLFGPTIFEKSLIFLSLILKFMPQIRPFSWLFPSVTHYHFDYLWTGSPRSTPRSTATHASRLWAQLAHPNCPEQAKIP